MPELRSQESHFCMLISQLDLQKLPLPPVVAVVERGGDGPVLLPPVVGDVLGWPLPPAYVVCAHADGVAPSPPALGGILAHCLHHGGVLVHYLPLALLLPYVVGVGVALCWPLAYDALGCWCPCLALLPPEVCGVLAHCHLDVGVPILPSPLLSISCM